MQTQYKQLSYVYMYLVDIASYSTTWFTVRPTAILILVKNSRLSPTVFEHTIQDVRTYTMYLLSSPEALQYVDWRACACLQLIPVNM